jgi:hypothetical protein
MPSSQVKSKLAVFFVGSALAFLPGHSARADMLQVGNTPVGRVHLPDGAATKGDFVLAVYSEDLSELPAAAETAAPLPTQTPLSGCFSVARISLHSGAAQLQKPATLTFGCAAAAGTVAVYGWIDGRWTALEPTRSSDGYVTVEFDQLTTYVVTPVLPSNSSKI